MSEQGPEQPKRAPYEGQWIGQEFELRRISFSDDISLQKAVLIARKLGCIQQFKRVMDSSGLLSDHIKVDIDIGYQEPFPRLPRQNMMSGDVVDIFPNGVVRASIVVDMRERKLVIRNG